MVSRRRNPVSASRAPDIERKLNALIADSMRKELSHLDRRNEFQTHVDKQFESAFGNRPIELDATGRQVPGTTTDEAIRPFHPTFDPRDMDLSSSVGTGGENRPEDVVKAKRLFGSVGLFDFDPSVERSTEAGPKFGSAVTSFQKAAGLAVDGRLEPSGPTLSAAAAPMLGTPSPMMGTFFEEIVADDETPQRAQAPSPDARPDPEKVADLATLRPDQRGRFEFDVSGPIRITMTTATLGLDGLRYDIDWFCLDENGEVMPEFRPRDRQPVPGGGHVMPGLPNSRRFVPPFDCPHGYRVAITVPAQPPVHGNSAGVQIDIDEVVP